MSTDKSSSSFANRLLNWFDQHGRKNLPWQIDKTPYRVWVSEIMLQQTQVSTVIDYFKRFMASFPDVKSLADADEDSVLEHWAGLGYYARARNLHKAAKQISYDLDGVFPEDVDGLSALPGIGRSTAGAIRSIAHKQYAPILDGNVKRVLCRYHAIKTWSGERKTEQKLWLLADEHTPQDRVDDYTQAIMDLGATLCTRSKPKCTICPMQEDCQANKADLQHALPVSKPKKKIPQKKTWALLIESDKGVLLEKRPPSGIWGGLYSLPEAPPTLTPPDLIQYCTENFGIETELLERHQSIHHTFSHYKLEIQPVKLKLKASLPEVRSSDRLKWIQEHQLSKLGLPAPISSYLEKLNCDDLFRLND